MRNLSFWTSFFQLPQEVHGPATPESKAALEKEDLELSDLRALLEKKGHSESARGETDAFDEKDLKQEALAVSRLMTATQGRVNKQKFAEAMELLDVIGLSDTRVRQAQMLKVECLRGLGRHSEATAASKELAAAWPPMNGLRRAFRFVGKVANDGKQALVSLTSKDKKA